LGLVTYQLKTRDNEWSVTVRHYVPDHLLNRRGIGRGGMSGDGAASAVTNWFIAARTASGKGLELICQFPRSEPFSTIRVVACRAIM
jgi:hypothetical protein